MYIYIYIISDFIWLHNLICSHIPGLWWKNCAGYHKDTCTKYIKVHQIYHLNHLCCRLRNHKVAVYGLAHSVRLKEMKGQSVSLCFHEHDWKHAILCSYHLPSLSAQILWTKAHHTTGLRQLPGIGIAFMRGFCLTTHYRQKNKKDPLHQLSSYEVFMIFMCLNAFIHRPSLIIINIVFGGSGSQSVRHQRSEEIDKMTNVRGILEQNARAHGLQRWLSPHGSSVTLWKNIPVHIT